MGASVLLFEKGRMGGDCLNYGCVPSKATIAAAHAASTFRNAGRFGITPEAPRVDAAALRRHVQGVIAAIAPHDSVERFEGLGVRVVEAPARFAGPRLLEGGGVRVKARWIVLATGSAPVVPPIPGLDRLPFLTNETVFDLEETPAHLLVLGGGPVGIELAQAHRRLGAEVTVVQRGADPAGAMRTPPPSSAPVLSRRACGSASMRRWTKRPAGPATSRCISRRPAVGRRCRGRIFWSRPGGGPTWRVSTSTPAASPGRRRE